MEKSNKDAMIASGFNHAFILAQFSPKLLDRVLVLQHVPEYKQGLVKGKERYLKNKELILASRKKQQERKATLDKIKAQNKGQEKEEKER